MLAHGKLGYDTADVSVHGVNHVVVRMRTCLRVCMHRFSDSFFSLVWLRFSLSTANQFSIFSATFLLGDKWNIKRIKRFIL